MTEKEKRVQVALGTAKIWMAADCFSDVIEFINYVYKQMPSLPIIVQAKAVEFAKSVQNNPEEYSTTFIDFYNFCKEMDV